MASRKQREIQRRALALGVLAGTESRRLLDELERDVRKYRELEAEAAAGPTGATAEDFAAAYASLQARVADLDDALAGPWGPAEGPVIEQFRSRLGALRATLEGSQDQQGVN